jgi:hypothetical protein
MKKVSTFLTLSILLIFSFSTTIISQTFDGEWSTALVTDDDNSNGTNQRTMSVAATTGDNNFVALVSRPSTGEYYLVGYKNATDSTGRLGASYSSGSDPAQTLWINGFDQVYMEKAFDIAAYGDLIFVANNDVGHNILVFELKDDSVYSYPMRLSTATDPFNIDSLWAIDVDRGGRVYVTTQGNETTPSKVLVYDSNDPEWTSGYSADPKQVITLPDNGLAHGVTANADGSVIYVSNMNTGKIYAYVGNITDAYTLSPSFNYENIDAYAVDTLGTIENIGPLGLNFMDDNNILFAAADSYIFSPNRTYGFGRIYIINPNTGEMMDTIDVADWNFVASDSTDYTTHVNNVASGYTSTYYVDFDENKNLYSQSYFSWTIEKWVYSGTLPMIELTLTDVEKIDSNIPNSFEVSQNYPNPFNPSTTIEFSINKTAPITLSVYNINGELITKLVNGAEFAPGVYKITFDASRLASGTYIYSISNGSNIITKKMTLLK